MTRGDELPREARSGRIFNPNWGTHAYAAYRTNTMGLDALLAMVFPEDDIGGEFGAAPAAGGGSAYATPLRHRGPS